MRILIDTNLWISALLSQAEMVQVISEVQVCRDPDDDYLLAICLDAQSNFLLTGDKDLLDLGVFGQTQIVSLTDFENRYFPYTSAR